MMRSKCDRWLCVPALERLEERDVPATVGGLDPSFGSGGKLIALGAGSNATDVAVDHLGRVVVAGNTPGPGGQDFLALRFNPDGTPDLTFGTGGTVAIDFAGHNDV